jgi:hypothetical protein
MKWSGMLKKFFNDKFFNETFLEITVTFLDLDLKNDTLYQKEINTIKPNKHTFIFKPVPTLSSSTKPDRKKYLEDVINSEQYNIIINEYCPSDEFDNISSKIFKNSYFITPRAADYESIITDLFEYHSLHKHNTENNKSRHQNLDLLKPNENNILDSYLK